MGATNIHIEQLRLNTDKDSSFTIDHSNISILTAHRLDLDSLNP